MHDHAVATSATAGDAELASEPQAEEAATHFTSRGAIPPVATAAAKPRHASASERAYHRAEATLGVMEHAFGASGHHFREHVDESATAFAWSEGQALNAELDVAAHTHNYRDAKASLSAIDGYRLGSGYAPTIHPGPDEKRFYDDTSWIGLDFLQAYHQTGNRADLQRAEAIFPFLRTGQGRGGGEQWEEGEAHPIRNMAATGSSSEVALELYQATHDRKYLQFGEKNEHYMRTHLRDGAMFKSMTQTGQPSTTKYTYNQGTEIGTELDLYRATHHPKYLAHAKETAAASVHYFGRGDRLWTQAPAFNAIFFRNLLELAKVAPDPSYKALLDGYLSRAWTHARDASGLFDRGGIGKYDHKDGHTGLLDESAFAEMYSLQAEWPRGR